MSESSILLVEDDPDCVLLTERAYCKAGFPQSFQVARDGEEAIAYLAGDGHFCDRERYPIPVLVLLDLKLPRKSGMDVLTWIRERADLKNLPVVILTTSREPDDLKLAYDLGANSFLLKPVSTETLQELFNSYVLPLEEDLQILLVDEDPVIRGRAAGDLRHEFPGIRVVEIGDAAGWSRALDQGGFALVITDYRLAWTDGLSILRSVKSRQPAIPVIMCAEDGSEEIAVEAMKAGLDDYVIKSPPHISRLVGAVRVVMAQAKHRKAARAAETRYRNLYESVPICLFRATLRGQIVDGNQSLKSMLGFDDMTSTSAYNLRDLLVDPADRERWQAEILRGEVLRGFEAQVYARDRQVIWAEINARVVNDERGKPLCMEGSIEDITARKQAQSKVNESEAEMRALFAAMNDVIMVIDAEGRYRKVAPTNAALLSRPAEELLNKTIFDVFPGQDAELLLGLLRRTLETGQTTDMEYRLPLNGKETWFTAKLSPMSADTVLMIAHDVTQRKQAERALQESDRRFRETLENVGLLALGLDREGKVTFCNDFLLRVIGYAREEVFGQDWFEHFMPPDSPVRKIYLSRMDRGVADQMFPHLESEILTRDGDRRLVRWSVSILPDRDGGLAGAISIGEDVTEQQRAEAALKDALAQLEATIKAIPDLMFEVDPKGRIQNYYRPQNLGLYLPAEAFLGKTVPEVMPENATRVIQTALAEAAEQGWHRGATYVLDTPKGQSWSELSIATKGDIHTPEGRFVVTVRDITERKQHERELESIAVISSAVRDAHTREEMLPAILDQVMSLMNATSAVLVRNDQVSGEIVVELARGEFGKSLHPRLPNGDGVSGYVINTGQVFQSADIREDALYGRSDVTDDVKSVVCVPLLAYGSTLGALWAGRRDEYTPTEVRLLMSIADIAANAIHRVTLHEQTERGMQRLAALHEIDTAINSSMDLQITLRVLLEQVISQLHVDAADVLLLNAPQHVMACGASRGFRTHAIERVRLRLGEGHAGKAALERTTVHVPDIPAIGNEFVRAVALVDESFVSYSVTPLIAKGQTQGVLEVYHRQLFHPDQEWLDYLETLAGQAAIAIDNAGLFADLQRVNDELVMAFDETIEGWSSFLDLRDRETEGHTRRVAQMTDRLARLLGVPDAELIHIRWGSLLHDIGKMGIPDSILLKPAALTDEEWQEMRKHPVYAYQRLSPIKYLRPALDIPYCHHEKWDGSGYPRGLKGEQIPLAARLFSVVDVWDALRSDRPYRKAWPEEAVLAHIRKSAGTHFDPRIVQAFLELTASGDGGIA